MSNIALPVDAFGYQLLGSINDALPYFRLNSHAGLSPSVCIVCMYYT